MSPETPKAGTLKKMGDDAFMNKNFDAAIKYYLAAVSKFPNFDRAWNNMGLAYRESGNLKFAVKCFKRAYQLNEKNDFALANIEACEKEIEDNLFGVKREKTTIRQVDPEAAPEKPTPAAPTPELGKIEQKEAETPTFLRHEESIEQVEEELPELQEEESPEAQEEEGAGGIPEEPPVPRPPPEKIVIEEKAGPLGLRSVSVASNVPVTEEDEIAESEYECPECSANISPDDTSCPSCNMAFVEGFVEPGLEEKFLECEETGETLGQRLKALHIFSGVDDEGLFKIYRVDKYLHQADWEISSGKFDNALRVFKNAERLLDSLFSKHLRSKAADIYSSIRSEVLALDGYEEHLGALAKHLFQAEKAIERENPDQAIISSVIIKDYLDKLNER